MSGNAPAGADPSMDDILASIRKILNEDDPSAATLTAPGPVEALQLTPEMMIAPPESLAGPAPVAPMPAPVAPTPVAPPPLMSATVIEAPSPARMPTNIMPPTPPEVSLMTLQPTAPSSALLDPLAAAGAVAALGQLTRAVAQERTASVTRHGPSIEDVVREELRPMLKAWLDAHLPATVERLVRGEIERVIARQG